MIQANGVYSLLSYYWSMKSYLYTIVYTYYFYYSNYYRSGNYILYSLPPFLNAYTLTSPIIATSTYYITA